MKGFSRSIAYLSRRRIFSFLRDLPADCCSAFVLPFLPSLLPRLPVLPGCRGEREAERPEQNNSSTMMAAANTRCMTLATTTVASAVLPRILPAISAVQFPILHERGVCRSSFSPRHRNYASTATTCTSNSQQGDRPFQILGVQQIAVGSLSKQSMSDIWIDVFGIKKAGTYQSEKENVDEDILKLGPEGSPYVVEVDLMTPLDPEKSPKVRTVI